MKRLIFFLIIPFLITACSDEEQKSLRSNEPIIGVWKLHEYVDPNSIGDFDHCMKNNTLTVYGDLSFNIITYGVNSEGECVEQTNKGSKLFKLRGENNVYGVDDSVLKILDPFTLRIQDKGYSSYDTYIKVN